MSSKIKSISAFECLDSRGFPTISATVELENGALGTAMVPSGASTGEHEAHELRDEDAKRYKGKGVLKAIANLEKTLAPAVIGLDACDQQAIDQKLIATDGSENKQNLGANAILAISLATAQAAAASQRLPLFRYIGGEQATYKMPVPMVNVINGGAHAANSLDFQEFMLVPHSGKTFSENIQAASEVFHTLKKNLQKKGMSTGIGDEGGFAPNLKDAETTILTLLEAISDAGYEPGKDIALALDVAASEMYNRETGKYVFKKSSGESVSSDDLINLYAGWTSKYPLVSIEDGLDENDWAGWTKLMATIGNKTQLVGDDLFVTNAKRLQDGINKKAANSILIKVNQIGTLSETLQTIALAHEHQMTAVMSHRSGETEDTIIADLAVATACGQIKTGSVCRGERTAKYNRLLWIEKFLSNKAVMATPFKA